MDKIETAEHRLANAHFIVGMGHLSGIGLKKDPAEAVKWFRQAAEMGHAGAQYALGIAYFQGLGVSKNTGESIKLFQQAANQGHTEAEFLLGASYFNGVGVTKNEVESVKCYRRAAANGHIESQYILGVAYHEGVGVGKDEDQAIDWYGKAADQGHSGAQTKLEEVLDRRRLNRELTTESLNPQIELKNGTQALDNLSAFAPRLSRGATVDRKDPQLSPLISLLTGYLKLKKLISDKTIAIESGSNFDFKHKVWSGNSKFALLSNIIACLHFFPIIYFLFKLRGMACAFTLMSFIICSLVIGILVNIKVVELALLNAGFFQELYNKRAIRIVVKRTNWKFEHPINWLSVVQEL